MYCENGRDAAEMMRNSVCEKMASSRKVLQLTRWLKLLLLREVGRSTGG